MQRDMVWISTPDAVHGNFGVQAWSSPDRVGRFVAAMLAGSHFPAGTYRPFFQGGSGDPPHRREWAYFEFWTGCDGAAAQDALLRRAQAVADEVGLPLGID